ncbi:uL22 family ribosomal protein [Candidatus Nasuia deltocephalinicola]|uniref:uL22 family ribosomal protein n=1 Tax=Candidatus Nasuia deltocephalincola TaxID=1160784 RepID=UPI00216B2EF9|nr:uL22 family ribosomal protein [Candidatus Nasuia deltocephalinicola]
MFYKFFFKNINISYKKFKIFIFNLLKFSRYLFELLLYLNFFNNKNCSTVKKIFLLIVNNLKMFNLVDNIYLFKIKEFSIGKGCSYSKYNYRAKGNYDVILKRFCNIFLLLWEEK